MCALLKGSGMAHEYWPHAFRHMLAMERHVAPVNEEVNAAEATTVSCPEGKRLQTWGCRVWIRKKG